MRKFKLTKNLFLKCFIAITLVLALVRLVFPSVAGGGYSDQLVAAADSLQPAVPAGSFPEVSMEDSLDQTIEKTAADLDAGEPEQPAADDMMAEEPGYQKQYTVFFGADGQPVKNAVSRVPSFKEAFPDPNALQLTAANKYGVRPVLNRQDAEARKTELVYVASNPFFFVDELSSSIPYLVPRAAVLLQDIGRNFMDSLQVKCVPMHKIMVTSVLRTKEDVEKLRHHNKNATENSCHLYGTTFDISYRRFQPVPTAQPVKGETPSQILRDVLSEVLRDLHEQNRCYVKFEVKQSCFHITVR